MSDGRTRNGALNGSAKSEEWKELVLKAAAWSSAGSWNDAVHALTSASEKVGKRSTPSIQQAISANLAMLRSQTRKEGGSLLQDLMGFAGNDSTHLNSNAAAINVAHLLFSVGCSRSGSEHMLKVFSSLQEAQCKCPVLMGYVCIRIAQQYESAVTALTQDQAKDLLGHLLGSLQTSIQQLREKKSDLHRLYAAVLLVHSFLLKWRATVAADTSQASEMLNQFRDLYERELLPHQGTTLRFLLEEEEQVLLLPLIGQASFDGRHGFSVQVKVDVSHYGQIHTRLSHSALMLRSLPIDDAMHKLNALRASSPEQTSFVYSQIGRLLVQQSKHRSAFLAYEQALQRCEKAEPGLSRRLAPLVYSLALCSLRTGNSLQAHFFLLASLHLCPEQRNNPLFLLRLAEASVQQYRQVSNRLASSSWSTSVQLVAQNSVRRIVYSHGSHERARRHLEQCERETQEAFQKLREQVGAMGGLLQAESDPQRAEFASCSLSTALAALSRACTLLLLERRQNSRPTAQGAKTLAAVLTNLVFVHLQLLNTSLALVYSRMLLGVVRTPSPVMAVLIAQASYASGTLEDARRHLADGIVSASASASASASPASSVLRGTPFFEGRTLQLGGQPEVTALEANLISASLCRGVNCRNEIESLLRRHADIPTARDWLVYLASGV